MSIGLSQILSLVGRLDDVPGEDAPSQRFRRYLNENVQEVGQVRDYVEECLRNKGDQYNRALQDLVNHLGSLLGFSVEFGRYQGIQGKIGFDGHWESPKDFHIVLEVKTTETYSIATATLLNYINGLISAGKIPNPDDALGLYVVGRPNPEIRQLENAIVAEKRTQQLRVISVDALLSLTEMKQGYDVVHDDILNVVRPARPTIDPIVTLIARLVAEPKPQETEETEKHLPEKPTTPVEINFWLTPVRSDETGTAEDTIQTLVGQEKVYAFGERTAGKAQIDAGDWICFYSAGRGVVAHAKVASRPTKNPHPKVRNPERYPWTFRIADPSLYLKNPVSVDSTVRRNLEAFKGKDPDRNWSWFVQATRRVSGNDFRVLTKGETQD